MREIILDIWNPLNFLGFCVFMDLIKKFTITTLLNEYKFLTVFLYPQIYVATNPHQRSLFIANENYHKTLQLETVQIPTECEEANPKTWIYIKVTKSMAQEMSRKSWKHVIVRMSRSVLWNSLFQKCLQEQDWNYGHINEHVTVKGGNFVKSHPYMKNYWKVMCFGRIIILFQKWPPTY